ncbi:ankyrin repeat and SAM domain-containing protein 6 [Pochonia chlamydosporia 170]|uniref:Ankyrin repeat and SAM domain-containing protein 6 n=1 Tax=Pochonia chlamydosporia 170 TaxID=1380566 RepID=A0A179FJJ8_METCM|nr:ankyrin repeat and SAM domain-containing protein 6 [Pochonia chlamydosporia 170]OAQ65209.2 ankyrin repeat and SAM domain-containing protein 6 [Pochonia chlamydosporia 170]
MALFSYKPIDLDRPGFRLFILFKGSYGSSISGELFEAWFDRPESVMPFKALSYTWGSPTREETITLNNKELGVTYSLYTALQYLRLENCDRILWIDAICIDQNNKTEQGHQVQQMGRIYQTATKVICWLGPADYETKALMESLRLLQQQSNQQKCRDWSQLWSTVQRSLAEKYPDLLDLQQKGLEKLLNAPWFERVWILQEVANARAAQICCGTQAVSSRVFTQAPNLLQATVKSPCKEVLDIMPGPLRQDSWWDETRDLYHLLQKFRGSKARDPRDKIFALLGMASDLQNTPHLIADYTKSVEDVILEAGRYLYGAEISARMEIEQFLTGLEDLNGRALKTYAALDTGVENIRRILQRGEDARVSAAAVTTAAGNRARGLEIMRMFSDHAKSALPTPSEAFKAAKLNETFGDTIAELLLMRASGLHATSEFFQAATRCLNMINASTASNRTKPLSPVEGEAIKFLWDAGGEQYFVQFFRINKSLVIPIPSEAMKVVWKKWKYGGKEIIDNYIQQPNRHHDQSSDIAIKVIGDVWSLGGKKLFEKHFEQSATEGSISKYEAERMYISWTTTGRHDIMRCFQRTWSLHQVLTLTFEDAHVTGRA